MDSKGYSNIIAIGTISQLKLVDDNIADEQLVFCFRVYLSDSPALAEILSYVYNGDLSHPFCLALEEPLDATVEIKESLSLAYISSLLAHPAYYKNKNEFIVVSLGKIESQDLTLTKTFHELFEGLNGQGFEQFELLDMSRSNDFFEFEMPFVVFDNKVQTNFEGFRPWFLQHLIASDHPLHILVTNPESIQQVRMWTTRVERELTSEESLLADALVRLFAKSNRLQISGREKRLIQNDLQSKNDYMDFLLRKSDGDENIQLGDLMKLKKYYHYEYEILPLWYKRFGHIIKVIMGKRSLRSLFNDRVKKYKN